MSPDDLIREIEEKYMEYIEMAEDRSAITCKILASLLIKEREYSDYYKKTLNQYISCKPTKQEKIF